MLGPHFHTESGDAQCGIPRRTMDTAAHGVGGCAHECTPSKSLASKQAGEIASPLTALVVGFGNHLSNLRWSKPLFPTTENNSWWHSLRSSALRRNAVPSSTIDQHPVFKDMSEALVFREWVCEHGSRIVPAVGCTSFLIAARSVAVVYR